MFSLEFNKIKSENYLLITALLPGESYETKKDIDNLNKILSDIIPFNTEGLFFYTEPDNYKIPIELIDKHDEIKFTLNKYKTFIIKEYKTEELKNTFEKLPLGYIKNPEINNLNISKKRIYEKYNHISSNPDIFTPIGNRLVKLIRFKPIKTFFILWIFGSRGYTITNYFIITNINNFMMHIYKIIKTNY